MLSVTLGVIPALITERKRCTKAVLLNVLPAGTEAWSLTQSAFPFVTRTSEQSSIPGGWSCCLPSPHSPLSSIPGGWFVISPHCPLSSLSALWALGTADGNVSCKGVGEVYKALSGFVEGKRSSFLLVFCQPQATEFSYLGMKWTELSWAHFSQTGFWKGLVYTCGFPKYVSGDPSLWPAPGMSSAACNCTGACCFLLPTSSYNGNFHLLCADCVWMEGMNWGTQNFCYPGTKGFSKVLFPSGLLEIFEGKREGSVLGDSPKPNKTETPRCLGRSKDELGG